MNPYVLTWTLVSAAGILLSGVLLIESVLDLAALKGIGNGRRVHVIGRIASEGIRLVIHCGFLYIGLKALDSPVSPGGPSQTVLVLITGNALLIIASLIAWVVRRRGGPHGMTALELEAEAVETAIRLRETADRAALRLLELAAHTQRQTDTRVAVAAEETAENTSRIADNTDPLNGA